MSLTTHIGGSQAIKRQKMALLLRLRRNFVLKLISFVTAVLLYFFVQQERNPMVQRVFDLPVVMQGNPLDVIAELDQPRIKVTATGPQVVIDALRENDISAVADLRSLPGDRITTVRVPLHYEFKLTREIVSLLSFEPSPPPHIEVHAYPQRTKQIKVEAHYPLEARPGYRYGLAAIKPERVTVSGRMDRVSRVVKVVADANSLEAGGGIDNDFALSARDADNNPVEGITLDVPSAHVNVPIVDEPYSKILSISPILNDQVQPGYRIIHVSTSPNQVKVAGRPQLIDTLSTLSTEEISVKDLTDSKTMSVPLILPRGVAVSDNAGNPISKVTVTITVQKVEGQQPPPGPPPTTTGP